MLGVSWRGWGSATRHWADGACQRATTWLRSNTRSDRGKRAALGNKWEANLISIRLVEWSLSWDGVQGALTTGDHHTHTSTTTRDQQNTIRRPPDAISALSWQATLSAPYILDSRTQLAGGNSPSISGHHLRFNSRFKILHTMGRRWLRTHTVARFKLSWENIFIHSNKKHQHLKNWHSGAKTNFRSHYKQV